ncbi:mitochondrial carrier protein LEU5 [Metarhizium robertsii ARSEF 23]|uniref:Mitochondrial thiamine pyrophosphate carrier 1 n=2 Tax=Metarhizium robertsii TaxID=568076 RepID=E9F2B7_METRA|nr:mitochondrial carrier protein LEU5 [Metarhizium robertsii ARSEF 23]EFY98206.2 mitochondrial carrier protein LEU5 [Metarhizium robertsii ARSEF 23]
MTSAKPPVPCPNTECRARLQAAEPVLFTQSLLIVAIPVDRVRHITPTHPGPACGVGPLGLPASQLLHVLSASGMPTSSPLMDHASMTELARGRVRQHVGVAAMAPAVASNRDAAVCPTDDEAITPRNRTRSWDYVWRSGVAGGLAGCAAKTIVAPLDRVKILFQASNPHFAKYTGSSFGVATAIRDIYHFEGGRGLFRGHSATLLRIFPYAGIKFLAYEQIRAMIIPGKEYETPLRRLLSGSLAGVTSVFFTYPLELIRVRMAFETKKDGRSSLSSICRQIYNSSPVEKSATARLPSAPAPVAAAVESTASVAGSIVPKTGLVNFYRGFAPTLLGMLPYAGMSFLTHDTVSDLMRHPSVAQYTTLPRRKNQPSDKPAPLRSWAELTSGGVAGMISQTSSYPLEVIRRRMQVSGAVGDGHRMRLGETARLIFQERGFRGFFVGLTIGYVKVIPMVAVSFYTYERMKLVFGI